ncbi:MAG: radical SAM protein, partial [Candidatus Bathyarchaeia archaeon]
MNKDCPKTLQIEVTNECNFNCQMCIRRVWNAKPENLNLDLYKKIVEAISQCLDKLILYGLGEPLLNPNFLNMLKIARRKLPKDCEISV